MGPGRIRAALIATLIAERAQWALWMPVCFGSGIAAYFALPFEPGAFTVCGLAAGLSVATTCLRRDAWRIVGLALTLAAFGLVVATLRTASLSAPVLDARTRSIDITATVVDVSPLPAGTRLRLSDVYAPGIGTRERSLKVQLTARGKAAASAGYRQGDRIQGRVVLRPPPAPVLPGAFDFQRHAYFREIGAYGFAFGAPKRIGYADVHGISRLTRAVATTRLGIADRIWALERGPPGAVAAALLTGQRHAIPKETLDTMRDAGIAHLLAISGLHIGLVAGLAFSLVRIGYAAVPRLGLRFDGKKAAALAALPAAFAYAVLAGFTVPTERAFLMTGMILLGIVIDRRALTLRTVAWAAFVVLALNPESLVEPGFQMSFAAVTALVSAYAWLSRRRQRHGNGTKARVTGTVMRYGTGVLLSTVIAGGATGPFAVHHFQHVAALGVVANAIAVPLAAFWVMPSGLAALITMPLGLEEWPLGLMITGIGWIIDSAAWVAALPGASADIPAPPAWSLLPLVFGGLWLALWQTRWRLFGVPVLLIGVAGPGLATTPDVIVAGDSRLAAVTIDSHKMMLSDARQARFQAAGWRRRLGYASTNHTWPTSPEISVAGLRCGDLGCVRISDWGTLAIAKTEGALLDDCRTADLLISLVPVRQTCGPRYGVVDRFDLWRYGTHTIRMTAGGVQIETVNGVRGRRPWVPWPE